VEGENYERTKQNYDRHGLRRIGDHDNPGRADLNRTPKRGTQGLERALFITFSKMPFGARKQQFWSPASKKTSLRDLSLVSDSFSLTKTRCSTNPFGGLLSKALSRRSASTLSPLKLPGFSPMSLFSRPCFARVALS